MKWVKGEFAWAHKTAANYMNFVRLFGHDSDIIETVTNSAIDLSALYKLMEPEVPQEVRDLALELAEDFKAVPEGPVVDRELVRSLIMRQRRKERAAERAAAGDPPPDPPIPPEDILARQEAFRVGFAELCRLTRHAAGVALPRSDDPKFIYSARKVHLDLIRAEYGDDDASRAMLRQMVTELDESHRQGSPPEIVTATEQKKRAARLENLLWPEGTLPF
jgi:hypothetical protein